MSNRLNTRFSLILTIAIIVALTVGALAAFLTVTKWYVYATDVIDIRFQVVEETNIGFNLDDNVIGFGKVPRGGGAERNVRLYSRVPAAVSYRFSESLQGWVHADDFSMDAGEPQNVTFRLDVPLNASLGNYTGNVTILYLRHLPWNG